MQSAAEELLDAVLAELGDLANEMVFTGGAIQAFHHERPPLDRLRVTDDADAVVECATYTEYHRLLERLRRKGFEPIPSDEHPICRVKSRQGHLLDVMPTAGDVLHFGNRWFAEGFRQAIEVKLQSGRTLRIFPPLLYAAAKVEAYNSRGRDDPWISHDLEDLLTLLDCRPSLESELANAALPLREYLVDFARDFLRQRDPDELIEGHLGAWQPGWRERNAALLACINRIATSI